MTRPLFEVGQIIRDYRSEFYEKHKPVLLVRQVFALLALCRTSELGGHKEVCPDCRMVKYSYNSCRNRHCPKCQNQDRETWLDMRREEIMPGVKYFHVVFTVPACLNPIAMSHQALFYTCLFKAAWDTMKKFYDNKGLQGGMTSILHTWGSDMSYHPHIHCIVPGGGIDGEGVWHHLDGCKDGAADFLFPVCAMSTMFRAKFMAMLTEGLKDVCELIPQDVRKKCMATGWSVFSRPPAKGVDMVLEYIGRYAYRVAISNSRIKNYEGGLVTYEWKDYRHGGMKKLKTLDAVDFLNLFSMHILPPGFVRIRHYGILSPSNRDKVRKVQIQLGGTPIPKVRIKKSYIEVCREKGWPIGICPNCGCRMLIYRLPRMPIRSPPDADISNSNKDYL